MNKFTTRQSFHSNGADNWYVCSSSGINDYAGRLTKQKAAYIADAANTISQILPNLNPQEIVDLVILNDSLKYE